MDTINSLFHSRHSSLLASIAMAWLWSMFAYSHVLAYNSTSDWSYLLFCASETLSALFFLVRSKPVSVSTDASDWLLAIGATFAPCFFSPSDMAIWPDARYLLVVGSTLQIAGLLSLNRSFGLVAARRSIKTQGAYRLVRHPLYASYLISFSGYLLANTSPANALAYTAVIVLMLVRLLREEQHLAQDVRYRVYMRQVKYRLLPFIF